MKGLLCVLVLFFTAALGQAAVRRVPSEYATIQAGINAAVTGDTVLVADGIYAENIAFQGKAISVVSENGAASCIIDANHAGAGVRFINAETTSSVLDGFTVQNGTGHFYEGSTHGGGIVCWEASPTIARCMIQYNSASWGGGMRIWLASPVVSSCTFSVNRGGDGGGLSCIGDQSEVHRPVIEQCSFLGNQSGWGGGLYCLETRTSVIGCTFEYNIATDVGGGIAIQKNYATENQCAIYDAVVQENTAGYCGAGIYCYSAAPVISNCDVSANHSNFYGGGICVWEYANPVISNSLVEQNYAADSGGGLFSHSYSAPTFTNCTVVNNATDHYGGGLDWDYYAGPTMTNCIFWFNSAPISPEIEVGAHGGDGVITHCDIAGGWEGEGNIDADPLFVTGPLGSYYLSQVAAGEVADSPCLDSGSASADSICFDIGLEETCLNELTTRSDRLVDTGMADMGYHYAPLCGGMIGDIDDDGAITTNDALTCFQIALLMIVPTDEESCRADADGNGRVTTSDSLCIFQEALGLPDS